MLVALAGREIRDRLYRCAVSCKSVYMVIQFCLGVNHLTVQSVIFFLVSVVPLGIMLGPPLFLLHAVDMLMIVQSHALMMLYTAN